MESKNMAIINIICEKKKKKKKMPFTNNWI